MKIYENGLDSFKKALIKLNQIDKSDKKEYEYTLKDIVINFHHSLETLFKYLVSLKSEFFIYEDISDIVEVRAKQLIGLQTKKEKQETIKFMDSLNRLIVFYNIEFEKEEYTRIEMLNKLRNHITHNEYDFDENEVEHLIALILPIIFKIFKKHIIVFEQFAKDNDIYSNVDSIMFETDVWVLEMSFRLKEQIDIAKERVNEYVVDPQKIRQLYDSRNTKYIYSSCPNCMKDFFVARGNVIEHGEETTKFGFCEYCGFESEKTMAKFIYLFTKSFDKGLNSIASYSKLKALESLFVSSEISKRTSEEIEMLKTLYQSKKTNINKEIKSLVEFQLETIAGTYSQYYFEDNISGDCGYGQRLLSKDDLSKSIDLEDGFEKYLDNDCCKLHDEVKELKKIEENYNFISNNKFGEVKETLLTQYVSSHDIIYPDPNWDNEDVLGEFIMYVEYTYDALIDKYEERMDELEGA